MRFRVESAAYSGRWSQTGGQVSHAVETASLPDGIGTTLTRETMFLPEGLLRLLTAWHDSNGASVQDTLVWARV